MVYLEDYLEKISENINPRCVYLDLRGTPCPLNFIRCKLAIERLTISEYLKVDLDLGEPEEMVISGLSKAGHKLRIVYKSDVFLTLLIDKVEI